MKRNGISLAVEARGPVTETDTIYYNMRNLSQQKYELRFGPENMNNLNVKAELIDRYLHTTTKVSLGDTTKYDFSVSSDAASKAADRFIVVFKVMKLPVHFTSVTASQENTDISVDWQVENESLVQHYEVEKSIDGSAFNGIGTVKVNKVVSGSYSLVDAHPIEGFNYYRIKTVGFNGDISYSQVVKVFIGSLKPTITVYPNPVLNGILNLQLANEPAGKYGIKLLNHLGQIIVSKEVTHAGGNGSLSVKWDYNLAHGVYNLEVIKPDLSVQIIRVLY